MGLCREERFDFSVVRFGTKRFGLHLNSDSITTIVILYYSGLLSSQWLLVGSTGACHSLGETQTMSSTQAVRGWPSVAGIAPEFAVGLWIEHTSTCAFLHVIALASSHAHLLDSFGGERVLCRLPKELCPFYYREKKLFSLKGKANKEKRMQIYKFLLEHFTDEQRFNITSKISLSILGMPCCVPSSHQSCLCQSG